MRLRKAADRTVSILGLGLFGVLTGFSLFLTSRFALSYEKIPRTTGDIFPLVLLICGCLTFVMYRISEWMLREEERQERRVRILAGAVFCYALLLGVWWVGAADVVPAGDQASICTAAEQFRNGNFEMLTIDSYEKYLYIYPHQVGLTAVMEVVFRLFGDGNYMAFEYLNCLCAALTLYFGYRVTRCLTGEKRAWIYELFLSAACFPLLFYTTFVYGEMLSIMLSMLTIWLFLEYRKREQAWWMIGCAFSCAAACLVRNNCLILLIALVLVLLVTARGERKWKLLLSVLLLAAVYLGAKNAVQTMYEQRSGVELNAGAPKLLWVAMGMQKGEGAPGWSNGYILHNYWGASDFDNEAAQAMAVQDIKNSAKEFLHHPRYALWFYAEKFASQWNDPTYECFAMTHMDNDHRSAVAQKLYEGVPHRAMTWFMNQYQSLIYGGCFLWILYTFWKKKDLSRLILVITVFGGFLFHMIWEAKGRYILPYFVLMLPMAAGGLAEASVRMREWLKRHGRLPVKMKMQ